VRGESMMRKFMGALERNVGRDPVIRLELGVLLIAISFLILFVLSLVFRV